MRILSSIVACLILLSVLMFSVSCSVNIPGFGNTNTGAGGESAGTGNENNGSGDENNGSGDENNGTGNENNGSGDENNGSGDENNGTGNENNGSGDENNGSGDENNGSGDENNGTGDENNGSADENNGSGDENNGSGDENTGDNECDHADADKNNYCDDCGDYLLVVIDLYAFNDLHGKFCDSDKQPGVDELGTYFENRRDEDDYMILLSSGDMWQGSAESVLTQGRIMIDWMNELGFAAMTLGNHEFDWGEEVIADNSKLANFPFLAINVYNKSTGRLADYCTPSVIVECGGATVGIIGAIGDCYSSISSEMVGDVTFKVKDELTALVKAESQRLRSLGVDIIIYAIHDGLDSAGADFAHYDTALSEGYVDVVLEAHTHQSYVRLDSYGIVHIQAGGENQGFSHIEIEVNPITGIKSVTEKNTVKSSSYAGLEDHPATEAIEDKYSDIIDYASRVLGTAFKKYTSSEMTDRVAELYLAVGAEKWGTYDIVLGGGFLKTRSPYDLAAGDVTYADLLSLFPFNNRITLCKISGRNLLDKFINTSNSDYHCALKDGFTAADVDPYGIYYVVVDTYTALYRYNNLTIVAYYDDVTYARDLLADAVARGDFGSGSVVKPDGQYKITPVSDALSEGERLAAGKTSSSALYYKGTLSGFENSKYGNCYLTDEFGDKIYVYGLYDSQGNIYQSMQNPPKAGDTVIIYSYVKKYKYPSGDIVIELVNSVVVAVNP